jgi:hypothetical protein
MSVRSLEKVEINVPEVDRLADLGSIVRELKIATELCDIALQDRLDTMANAIMADGLLTAAVIRYVRCFHNTGKRFALSHDDVPEDLRECHTFFRTLRDKHLAHSVNDMEQPYVSAYIEYEGGVMKPVQRLLAESERLILNKRYGALLRDLISAVRDVAEDLKESEHDIALAYVNQLDETAMKKFRARAPMTPNFDSLAKGRMRRKSTDK